MNSTLSTRQLRLVVLLVLVVVAAGGFMVVTRNKPTTTQATSTPVSTPATTTPTPSKTHSHTVTPAKVNVHGLPVPVARALHKHSVVVVALYVPGASVDATTFAEAQAGARNAGVGFVKLDVLHQRGGTAMLRKLGVVNTPVVLVVKRPANIYSEFKGFVDRDVVAQAVAEAR
jgi:thiol:disulfide interchange protein